MVANNPFETHDSFRFAVIIDEVVHASFDEFVMPSFQVETMEIKEGGQNAYVHKLPVRVSVGNATLRHGVTRDMKLLNWYMDVLKGDVKASRRYVMVVMYDVKHLPIVSWGFRDAYPVKWSGPRLKADDNTIAVEEIEFVHQGFEVG
jgi:phage tail-like protein